MTVLKALWMIGQWRTCLSKDKDPVEANDDGNDGGMFDVSL